MTKEELLSLFGDKMPELTQDPYPLMVQKAKGVSGDIYYYIPIETLENLMDIYFKGWDWDGGYQKTFIDGGCLLEGNGNLRFETGVIDRDSETYYPFHQSYKTVTRSGNAAKFITDYRNEDGELISWKNLIPTEFPAIVSAAKASAIKSICRFFGRDLNRGLSNEIVIEEAQHKVEADEVIMAKYKEAIKRGDEKVINEIKANYIIGDSGESVVYEYTLRGKGSRKKSKKSSKIKIESKPAENA